MKVLILTILKRAFVQAMKSLKRSKWTNLATFLALTLVFLLVHIMSAFTYFAESLVQNLEKKVDIGVFFTEEVIEVEIREFLTALNQEKIKGNIKDYSYFPKEKALEDFEKKYPGRMVFLRRYNLDNPLVSMVEIVPNEAKLDVLLEFLNNKRYSDIIDQEYLRKNEDDKKRINNFISIANFTEKTGGAIFLFFLFVSTGLIFYAVNNAVRKHDQEIFIMRLVGARFWQIRSSFLIEGFLITFFSFICSLFFASLLFYVFSLSVRSVFLDPELSQALSVHLNKMLDIFSVNVLWSGVIILVLALVASFLAIERQIRSKETAQIV